MTSFEVSLSAGRTPMPPVALVSNSGPPSQFSSALMLATGITPGRSRLLYWNTTGKRLEVDVLVGQVRPQARQRLQVLLAGAGAAVGHEHHTVRTRQHQPPRGLVEDLPRHGVELEAHAHPLHVLHVQRQEVEEDRPVALGGQRHQLAAALRLDHRVDVLERRRFPRQAGAVVDDLRRDLPREGVDDRHCEYGIRSELPL